MFALFFSEVNPAVDCGHCFNSAVRKTKTNICNIRLPSFQLLVYLKYISHNNILLAVWIKVKGEDPAGAEGSRSLKLWASRLKAISSLKQPAHTHSTSRANLQPITRSHRHDSRERDPLTRTHSQEIKAHTCMFIWPQGRTVMDKQTHVDQEIRKQTCQIQVMMQETGQWS